MAYAEAGRWDGYDIFTRDMAGDKTGKEDGTRMQGIGIFFLLRLGTCACWK